MSEDDLISADAANRFRTELFMAYAKDCGEALAIQPDDAALKAWLGEPVAKVSSYDINTLGWLDTSDRVGCGDELYHPKELKGGA